MIILYLQYRINFLAELVAEAVSEMLSGFFMGDTVLTSQSEITKSAKVNVSHFKSIVLYIKGQISFFWSSYKPGAFETIEAFTAYNMTATSKIIPTWPTHEKPKGLLSNNKQHSYFCSSLCANNTAIAPSKSEIIHLLRFKWGFTTGIPHSLVFLVPEQLTWVKLNDLTAPCAVC